MLFAVFWFFHNQLLRKQSGIPSECQTFWIQIRPDVLPGLIWVQTVCKGYEQTTIVSKEFNTIYDFKCWIEINMYSVSFSMRIRYTRDHNETWTYTTCSSIYPDIYTSLISSWNYRFSYRVCHLKLTAILKTLSAIKKIGSNQKKKRLFTSLKAPTCGRRHLKRKCSAVGTIEAWYLCQSSAWFVA